MLQSKFLTILPWIQLAKMCTDKLTHTFGLELQNSCDDSIITDRWLHFERNLMQKEAEYSHF